MKYSISILAFLLVTSAFGKTALEALDLAKPNTCYESAKLGYRIVEKIDDHTYALSGNGVTTESAILKTKKAVFDNPGLPVAIKIKHVKDADMIMLNGFSKNYPVWEECSVDLEVLCSTRRNRAPVYSWPNDKICAHTDALPTVSKIKEPVPIKAKESVSIKDDFSPPSCQDSCFQKEKNKMFKEGETLEGCLREACG